MGFPSVILRDVVSGGFGVVSRTDAVSGRDGCGVLGSSDVGYRDGGCGVVATDCSALVVAVVDLVLLVVNACTR